MELLIAVSGWFQNPIQLLLQQPLVHIVSSLSSFQVFSPHDSWSSWSPHNWHPSSSYCNTSGQTGTPPHWRWPDARVSLPPVSPVNAWRHWGFNHNFFSIVEPSPSLLLWKSVWLCFESSITEDFKRLESHCELILILRLNRSTDPKRSREPHQNGVIFRAQALNNPELCSHLVPNFSWVLIVGEPLVVPEGNWRVQCLPRRQLPCLAASEAQKSKERGTPRPRFAMGPAWSQLWQWGSTPWRG